MKPLSSIIRPSIARLAPYSSARNEYSGTEAHVFLDANENPYNSPLNRYPDPLQTELRHAVSARWQVAEDCIFIGNGSDEAIDLVYRCFCEPRIDNVVAIEPSYGMYKVAADINDVEYRPVTLDDHFQFSADRLLAAADDHTKAIWLCSPNNPTGNNLDRDEMLSLLQRFEGLVVIDEAYIDFSRQPSMRRELSQFPNLIVLSTLSKAWGCAAIRLGLAFASTEIISVFNKVKYPYNVNMLSQQKALEAVRNSETTEHWVNTLLQERERVMNAFGELPLCETVFPSDANFFLARVKNADRVYNYLKRCGIIVRNRSRVTLCGECLRVTVGTRSENSELIGALRVMPAGE